MNERKAYDLKNRMIDFAVEIIKLTKSLPKTRTDNHIADQILRSGTSPAPKTEISDLFSKLCYLLFVILIILII